MDETIFGLLARSAGRQQSDVAGPSFLSGFIVSRKGRKETQRDRQR